MKKTLAEYGSKPTPAPPPPPTLNVPPNAHASASSTPAPAIPPHMHPQAHHYRTGTPPSQPYPYSNGHQPVQAQSHPTYGQQAQYQNAGYGYNQPQAPYGGYPGYGAPQPAPAPPPQNTNVDALANIGDEQKVRLCVEGVLSLTLIDVLQAFLMRVLSMTPEQVHALPNPADRQTYIQLRTHMGVPT
ncbi:hypothetical protein DXG03_007332 [Asterophora parasitica]|uniref:Uncharacterized protein n=1 Tax=Asterophora parasitica TaxID=117018 RepID=A0A9P7GD17_9AGAR|nr:hypothetical protein DXG03_007332 [Asterophora parasitica]